VSSSATLVCKASEALTGCPVVRAWAKGHTRNSCCRRPPRCWSSWSPSRWGCRPGTAQAFRLRGRSGEDRLADVDRLVGNTGRETPSRYRRDGGRRPSRARYRFCTELRPGRRANASAGAFTSPAPQAGTGVSLDQQVLPAHGALARRVFPFAIKGAEQQLHHLGRRRLTAATTGCCKCNSLPRQQPLPERMQFERLLIRLARKNPPVTSS